MFLFQIPRIARAHSAVSTMAPADFNGARMAVFEPVGSYDIPEEEDNDGINEASLRLSLFAAVEGDGASSCRSPLVRLASIVSSRQTIGNSCFDSVTQVS